MSRWILVPQLLNWKGFQLFDGSWGHNIWFHRNILIVFIFSVYSQNIWWLYYYKISHCSKISVEKKTHWYLHVVVETQARKLLRYHRQPEINEVDVFETIFKTFRDNTFLWNSIFSVLRNMTSLGEGVAPLHERQGIKNLEHAFLTKKLNNKKFKKQFGYTR